MDDVGARLSLQTEKSVPELSGERRRPFLARCLVLDVVLVASMAHGAAICSMCRRLYEPSASRSPTSGT